MPRIQTYQAQTRLSGPIQTRRATGEDFGSGVASAFVGMFEELDAITDKVRQAERASKLSTAQAQAAAELKEYTFSLQNGSMDEQGNISAPPSPEQHYELYQQKVSEINERYRQQLDDRELVQLFQQDFQKLALASSFDVRKNAIEKRQGTLKAQLDLNLETLADVAATGDRATQHMALTEARASIGRLVDAGALSPEDGVNQEQKFRSLVARAGVRESIRANPDAALQQLLTGRGFDGLDPDERQRWIDTAVRASEADMRAAIAAEERAWRMSERAEREMYAQTAKDGYEADAKGELDVDWALRNRERLSEADYKYFLKRATGEEGPANSDPALYARLREDAGRGTDVRPEAKDALLQGRLKQEDYTRIVSEVENNAAPSWYKRGSEYIMTAIRSSDIEPNPALDLVKARTLDDWKAWSDAHPDATEEQAQKVYRQFTEDAMLIDTRKLTLALPKPTFLVGSRQAPDIAATWAATKDAFERGALDEFEYKRQARLLNEWRRATENGVGNGP